MPYLRIARDKRGYEYYSLIQPMPARRGKVQQRLLYWFRTPPNLTLGRPPFDDQVKRALEAQYPEVQFDWEALCNTPMPPPSAEPWRERRRAERAARQFRESDDTEVPAAEDSLPPVPSAEPPAPLADEEPQGSAVIIVETVSVEAVVTFSETTVAGAPAGAAAEAEGNHPRGRRRRRGRRGRPDSSGRSSGQTEAAPPSSTQAEPPPEGSDEDGE